MKMAELHRRYHGTIRPGVQPNIPIQLPRRTILKTPHHPDFQPRTLVVGGSNSSHKPKLSEKVWTREKIESTKPGCHYCQLESFPNFDAYPVAIINDVDQEVIPPDFKFIEDVVLRDGVERADEDFRLGCDCESDSDCLYQGCHCLQDLDVEENQRGRPRQLAAYVASGPKIHCLRESLLNSRDPIYECHDKCECSDDCVNRVVQRGRQIPLEIFRTSDGRGWGVRSTVNIKEGQFVDRYIGEIITEEEAQKRREASDIAQRKDVYLFALDKFSDPNSHDPRLAGPPFEVDGEFMAGPTRFINHSCNPNLRIFARVGDHADKHIHDLAFFAIDDIDAGEELTFDYVDGQETDFDASNMDLQPDMTMCLCGSDNCRGFLW